MMLSMIRRYGLPFAILSAALLAACEKDDICVAGDTPLLILTFHDQENRDQSKEVESLRVIGLGRNSTVNTLPDRADQDSIALPLQLDVTRTGFVLIASSGDSDGVETGNQDTLYFDYTVREEFISRACGFVARYENLSPSLNSDTDNWIQDIEVLQDQVTDQTSAHVKIYH